jgi:hypothetical protein
LAILIFLRGTGAAMALMVGTGILPWGGHQLKSVATAASPQPHSSRTAPADAQSPRSETARNSSISTANGGRF